MLTAKPTELIYRSCLSRWLAARPVRVGYWGGGFLCVLISFCAHIYILLIIVVSTSFRRFISLYALWFLARAAFWCLFAPSFAHERSQHGNIVASSFYISYITPADPTINTDPRPPICNTESRRPWRKFLAHSFAIPLFPRLKLRCRHDLDGGSFIFNNGCPSQLPIYFFAAEPFRTVWLAIQPESESAFVNVQFKTRNCTFADRATPGF